MIIFLLSFICILLFSIFYLLIRKTIINKKIYKRIYDLEARSNSLKNDINGLEEIQNILHDNEEK